MKCERCGCEVLPRVPSLEADYERVYHGPDGCVNALKAEVKQARLEVSVWRRMFWVQYDLHGSGWLGGPNDGKTPLDFMESGDIAAADNLLTQMGYEDEDRS